MRRIFLETESGHLANTIVSQLFVLSALAGHLSKSKMVRLCPSVHPKATIEGLQ